MGTQLCIDSVVWVSCVWVEWWSSIYEIPLDIVVCTIVLQFPDMGSRHCLDFVVRVPFVYVEQWGSIYQIPLNIVVCTLVLLFPDMAIQLVLILLSGFLVSGLNDRVPSMKSHLILCGLYLCPSVPRHGTQRCLNFVVRVPCVWVEWCGLIYETPLKSMVCTLVIQFPDRGTQLCLNSVVRGWMKGINLWNPT